MANEQKTIEIRTELGEVSLEERADSPPKIVGYGSVFYDGKRGTEYELPWGAKERIMPGAFDRALKEKQDVRGLFNHNPDHVLGRTKAGTMTLSTDAKGLRYEIEPGDTNTARDVMAHLKRGDVSGSSFAFIVQTEEWRKENGQEIREIQDVDLFDVGPVTYPAYKAASSGLRSSGSNLEEARASYDRWKASQEPEPRTFPPASTLEAVARSKAI